MPCVDLRVSFLPEPPCWPGEITVQLYCRDLALGNELVALQPDGNPLLGKVVEWKGV